MLARRIALFALALSSAPAWPGPPYFTDDPVPTDESHFEIYAFADGLHNGDGTSSDLGIDFNYGGARDLQLTAVLPIGYEQPRGAASSAGLGNVELAVKYRFLHQQDVGWDVAVFPRVFLSSASSRSRRAAHVLPVAIVGGQGLGSVVHLRRGRLRVRQRRRARDYCFAGWVLARQVLPALQVGAELYYQSADSPDAREKGRRWPRRAL